MQGPVEWETDRGRFLGRGRGPEDPVALDGRAALGHHGGRAGSDRQPATAHPSGPRRIRATVLRDRDGLEPGCRAGHGPEVSRSQRRRAHLRAGLHPCAEHVAAPGHLQRRGPALRAPRLPGPVHRRLAAGRAGGPGAQRAGPIGPVAPRDLRRSPHPPGARGRGRRHPPRPPGPPGPGVLAAQGPERGPRHPERAPGELPRRDARRSSPRCSTPARGERGSTGRVACTCCAATG